jgi:hypothetical protein
MTHVDIHGEIHFYDGPKGLLNLIDEKMGHDTKDALEEFIQEGIDLLKENKRKDARRHFEAAL